MEQKHLKRMMGRWVLWIVLLGLFSCKKDERRTEAEKIVSEWVGKEIKFPSGYECRLLGKDTRLCADLLGREYKVLLYVDSMGCTSCKLRISEWKQRIAESDSLLSDRLGFLFFFHPKDEKELQFLFKRDGFDYPVFIDHTNQINTLNNFPDKQSYQCFLLDRTNKVVMIGNPAINPRIWELYKEQIVGKLDNKHENRTAVEPDKTAYDYGDITIGTENRAVFTLKNTGTHPLVIQHIAASCGCTAVDWEKQPVEPGKTTDIKVEMQPEEAGYFNKTISVYCNIKESPLILTVMGRATWKN